MQEIHKIIFASICLLFLDTIYLTVNKKLFESQVIRVQHVAMKVNYWSAIICYVLLIAGLYFFILRKNRPSREALLLGIIIYGVYETTNYALLKNWHLQTVILDTLWGGILLSLTATATYRFMKAIEK